MKKRNVALIILILILIYAVVGVYYNLTHQEKTPEVKEVDKVDKYNYVLKSNATELQKTQFNELKEILSGDIVDDDYAKIIAKMFVTDLYTLTNKINKYDVGGIDYVFENGKNNYKLNVEDTLYKYLEDNTDNKRNQELPLVTNVDVENIESIKYKIGETSYDAKKVLVNITYEKDLGYDTKVTIVLVKDNDYYYVVECTK
ncbi:MAG: hypothetical protein MST00_00055 [Tenericutes bacterium]|nr:hypothetical protein [Mycoplasmatota bacterium]